jgi:hypothetical protein
MSKFLRAEQVEDGWVLKITETKHVHSESDVWDEIRYLGLTKKEHRFIRVNFYKKEATK